MTVDRAHVIASEVERIDGRGIGKGAAAEKHRKMAANPFRFLRGSAQLFYADLAAGTVTVPDAFRAPPATRIIGDCHLENFGFFTEEGAHGDRVIWAPNDFDDACVGPAVFDLLRMTTSLHLTVDYLAGLVDGLYEADEFEITEDLKAPKKKDAAAAAEAFLSSYATNIAELAKSADARDVALDDFPKKHFLADPLKKARDRVPGGKRFHDKSTIGKLVRLEEGKPVFKKLPDRFERLDSSNTAALKAAFRPYVDDAIVDVVRRIGAGTGSVNIDRYYLLVAPAGQMTEDDLHLAHVIEVKQQREAAMIHHFPDLSPVNSMNAAHLTVDCQRRMMRRPDLVLDEVDWRGIHWLVRSRHHARLGVDTEDLFDADKPGVALVEMAEACGETLARAHARGDRRSTRFEAAMQEALDEAGDGLLDAAQSYAQQVIRDHQLFVSLRETSMTED